MAGEIRGEGEVTASEVTTRRGESGKCDMLFLTFCVCVRETRVKMTNKEKTDKRLSQGGKRKRMEQKME